MHMKRQFLPYRAYELHRPEGERENRGKARKNDLTKITQVISGKAKIGTWVSWLYPLDHIVLLRHGRS